MTKHLSKQEKVERLLKGLPEEELGPDFDSKFWRRFEAEKDLPLPQARFGVPVLASCFAAVGLIGLCVATGFLLAHKDAASVSIFHGTVVMESKKTKAVQVVPSQAIREGTSIKTGSSSWAVVELKKGIRIKINPDTELFFDRLESRSLFGQTCFFLKKGEALVSIRDEHGKKYPLSILTPISFAKAVGTQFVVFVSQASQPLFRVSVNEGFVEVGRLTGGKEALGKKLLVGSGQAASVEADQFPLQPETLALKERHALEEQFQFGRKNRFILILSMSPQRVRELLKPCAVYIQMDSASEEAKQMQLIAKEIQRTSGKGDLKRHLLAVHKLENLAARQKVLDTASLKLFIGAYYSYLNEQEKAVQIFEGISQEYAQSQYASLALMAAATIYHDKLNLPEKAVQTSLSIVQRYPNSYERKEALDLIEKVKKRL